MNINDIKIGTRLELEILTDADNSVQKTYISQFIDILSDQEISISCPIFESKFVFISIGKKICLSFHDAKNGLMSFDAVISSRERKGNIMLLNVKVISKIEKMQRRNYFRLDCLLDAQFDIGDESIEAEQSTQPDYTKKAIAKNISGSGACIVTEDKILKNATINLRIFLNSNIYITAQCIVIRSSTLHDSSVTRYELGLYFKEISSKDQDLLIKFIFDQQRLQLKKNT